MSKVTTLHLGYEIHFEKNTYQPKAFHFWNQPQNFEKFKPTAPLKFMADALLGLSFVKLNSYAKSPLLVPHLKYENVDHAWKNLEPHRELYVRSQERVQALRTPHYKQPEWVSKFETSFIENFEACIKPTGIDFSEFESLLHSLSWLESKLDQPLLYNFNLSFSPAFTEKLHAFYSFLFHLRSLVAVDFNAHIEDPAHEGVKVDSITDYLPKAEYVANDAILYYQFKTLAEPWRNRHREQVNGEHPAEKLFVEPLQRAFSKYVHNACCLIDQLPNNFLKALNPMELEEALYLVQMDWLLGSPAGLLFRVREEIYGITHGYENIFWQDTERKHHGAPSALTVAVQVTPECWGQNSAA
ncbi:MAG: hypothetical protein ACLGGX_12105 [Bdellovibrionia bacterium]